jgi:6-pyruvoyltetrahydropterin/6-carboxytetrahydropterin synthase
MLSLVKHYRFHAAHRNRELNNKCSSIHGHTYHVTCTFRVEDVNPETGITIEFAEIDDRAAIVFDRLDHTLLLHKEDPLLAHLQAFEEPLKLTVFDVPTSAENLCMEIHMQLLRLGLPVELVQLMETPRSGVSYSNDRTKVALPRFDDYSTVKEHLPLPQEQTRDAFYERMKNEFREVAASGSKQIANEARWIAIGTSFLTVFLYLLIFSAIKWLRN